MIKNKEKCKLPICPHCICFNIYLNAVLLGALTHIHKLTVHVTVLVRNFALQCKNVSMSPCSWLRLALFLEATLPAAENSRSDGVEVPGMHK